MENQIVAVDNNVTSLIDSVDIEGIQKTMSKIATLQIVVKKNLKENHDFGVIAGQGSKPTLLKPGGEKICMLFGLNPEYKFLDKTEDYEKGFFTYNVKCTLYRNGNPVSQGVGNCNSMEKKYKYVNSDTIPSTIDPSTVEEITDKWGKKKYKIPNPHIADLVNTILKMSKKRAFIDAVLQVASLSDVFTQDLEDMRGFIQQERTENLNEEDAANLKINFGKHKGETLGQIMKESPDYINWLIGKSNDEVIRKACQMLINKDLNQNKANENKNSKSADAKGNDAPPWDEEAK